MKKRRFDEYGEIKAATGVGKKELETLTLEVQGKLLRMSKDEIEEWLVGIHPDSPLVNKREIAKEAGYPISTYFWNKIATMPGSLGHYYKEGAFMCTHPTSAQAWGKNIKEAIREKNKEGWAERTKGWRHENRTNVTSGSCR